MTTRQRLGVELVVTGVGMAFTAGSVIAGGLALLQTARREVSADEPSRATASESGDGEGDAAGEG